jgi:hypothetical protein
MNGNIRINLTDDEDNSSSTEFTADIQYEYNHNLENVPIERLFIRKRMLDCDTYYTMQLTSYNNSLWQGCYTSIYPSDLGTLSNLQIELSASGLYQPWSFNNVKKRRIDSSTVHNNATQSW